MNAPRDSFAVIPLPDGPFILAIEDDSPPPKFDEDALDVASDIAAQLHERGRDDALIFLNLNPALVCEVCSAKVHDLDKHRMWRMASL